MQDMFSEYAYMIEQISSTDQDQQLLYDDLTLA